MYFEFSLSTLQIHKLLFWEKISSESRLTKTNHKKNGSELAFTPDIIETQVPIIIMG